MTTCTRTGLRGALTLATGFTTVAAALLLAAPANADENERIDVAVDGGVPDSPGGPHAITPDGRFVAFQSRATNLVAPGVPGNLDNIYVRDRQTGMTDLVSVDSDGNRSDNNSNQASISADGRFVAFRDNFRGPETARFIYVRDRQTGETEQIDGDASLGSWNSLQPQISADGRYVAFTSDSPFLVPNGNPAGFNIAHVFVRDLQTDETRLVTESASGVPRDKGGGQPAISADGRFVAFVSGGEASVPFDQLGDIFVKDLETGIVDRITNSQFTAEASAANPVISADGRIVAFESNGNHVGEPDANGSLSDIYAHDRQTGVTWRVSVASDGTQANERSNDPAISPDGGFVTFVSRATNLDGVDGNGLLRDIYLHDLDTGKTERVSVASDGGAANEQSAGPAVSADAAFVAFASGATNIVSDGFGGAFVRIRVPVPPDTDGDGVVDAEDNCPDDVNPNQMDTDGDEEGDVCDADDDNDTVADGIDNCPLDPNSDQADADGDGIGDACTDDDDGDGVVDGDDACVPTGSGEVVNEAGCSIADLVPCDNPSGWKNHGAYISMTARTAEQFLEDGLITEEEKDTIVSEAGESSCGSK